MTTVTATGTTGISTGGRVLRAAGLHYLTNPWVFIWAPLIAFFGLLAAFVVIAVLAGPGGGTTLGLIMSVLLLMQAYQSVSSVFSLSQALGLTRREYLAGACTAGAADALIIAVLLTVLGAAEHATGGYGLGVVLAYSPAVFERGAAAALASWLIALLGAFIAGLFTASLRRRFGAIAIWMMILALVLVATASAALIGALDAWPQVGGWVERVGPLGVALWAIPVEAVGLGLTYLVLRRTPA